MIWSVPKRWVGETAFVIAGGPSVDFEDVTKLRGRRVIVVNSSYEIAPDFAAYCFFGDLRWWELHSERPAFKAFKGRFVSCSRSAHGEGLLKLNRIAPNINEKAGGIGPGLSLDPRSVVCQRTSLQGAMNLAFHLGAAKIVLVGADMGRAADGRSHHHTPHPWENKPGNRTWDIQMTQLRLIAEPLERFGVKVVNTSPVSRIDWWPKARLADFY